jgi:pyochelin biosynthetic protein PchC
MPDSAPDRRPRLVCLPYAGGSAYTFTSWPAALADIAAVTPVSLPGRADRGDVPPVLDLAAAADRLAADLMAWPAGTTDRPVALFGYSLGALLGFETARRLTAAGRPPAALVVAACAPPAAHRPGRLHLRPDRDLIDWIRRLGGIPESVLDDPDMLAILLPVLRADVALSECYRYQRTGPMPVPITTIAGQADPETSPAAMDGWEAETTLPLRQITLPGGHMFIEHETTAIMDVLRRALTAAGQAAGQAAR